MKNYPTITHSIEQGSVEWDQIRKGRFGGTDAALFLVDGKNADRIGAGLSAEYLRKVAEKYLDDEIETFPSKAMQRGTEYEPHVRTLYEDETFCEVVQVGYISRGDWFGVSPDGLVGDSGAIEIKCPLGPEYLRFMITGEIDKSHYAQMQWLLALTGRAWCDYVVWHPGASLLITTIERDENVINTFFQKAEIVEAELIRIENRLLK